MTNFGWDLPPGVSSLPGDHDRTASYSITFPYTFYNDDGDDHIQVIADCIEITDYTVNSITPNPDGSFTAMITYEDDLDIDPRGMDMGDVEETIIEHLNTTYHLNIDPRDDAIMIDVDVHR